MLHLQRERESTGATLFFSGPMAVDDKKKKKKVSQNRKRKKKQEHFSSQHKTQKKTKRVLWRTTHERETDETNRREDISKTRSKLCVEAEDVL